MRNILNQNPNLILNLNPIMTNRYVVVASIHFIIDRGYSNHTITMRIFLSDLSIPSPGTSHHDSQYSAEVAQLFWPVMMLMNPSTMMNAPSPTIPTIASISITCSGFLGFLH